MKKAGASSEGCRMVEGSTSLKGSTKKDLKKIKKQRIKQVEWEKGPRLCRWADLSVNSAPPISPWPLGAT